MKAGNKIYNSASDISSIIPVFPLTGALLLPGGNMPLNIFEPRYLAMVDDALAGDRLIGMIQPELTGAQCEEGPELCNVGCVGRLTGYQESCDGRYLINLTGVCRFKLVGETTAKNGYRRASIEAMESDLAGQEKDGEIDRETLIETFRDYLKANRMETDWDAVEKTDDETLVTALCMMSPYGAAEKQALLEAGSLKERAETLVALTQMALARDSQEPGSILQ